MSSENWIVIDQEVSVAGRVLDSISKLPLPGVMVEIENGNLSFKQITVSGMDGAYYFLNVPNGKYKMTAQSPSQELMYGTWENDDVRLPISDRTQRITVNIELAPTCLEGTVRDDEKDPAPISGATVRVWGNAEGVVSDQAGQYRLIPIMSGNPMIEVFAKGYQSQRLTVSDVEVGETKQVDVVLSKVRKQTPKRGRQ